MRCIRGITETQYFQLQLDSHPTWDGGNNRLLAIEAADSLLILFLCGGMAAASASLLPAGSFGLRCHQNNNNNNPPTTTTPKSIINFRFPNRHNSFRVSAASSVSISNPHVRTAPDDLVASLLSKVYMSIYLLTIVIFIYISK